MTLDEEPFSRAALWSRRLALFAVPVTAIAVLVLRSGRVELDPAMAAMGAGLLLALLAVALGIVGLAVIWVRGDRGAMAATFGLLIGAAILALPLVHLYLALTLPAINDISTDPGDPPAFVFAAADRSENDNDIAYAGEQVGTAQLAAYPEVVPLRLPFAPNETHALVLELVRDRGWRVLDDGAGGSNPRRRIEAVATTPLVGFADDVVVRIRPNGTGSLVDMRSASRIGAHDLGTNARRIRSFMADLAATAR